MYSVVQDVQCNVVSDLPFLQHWQVQDTELYILGVMDGVKDDNKIKKKDNK